MFTNNNYIADVEFEKDLPIDTPVMACRILNDWHFGYYMGGGNRIATEKINNHGKKSFSIYSDLKYIIKAEDFDFNNPENSLKHNKAK